MSGNKEKFEMLKELLVHLGVPSDKIGAQRSAISNEVLRINIFADLESKTGYNTGYVNALLKFLREQNILPPEATQMGTSTQQSGSSIVLDGITAMHVTNLRALHAPIDKMYKELQGHFEFCAMSVEPIDAGFKISHPTSKIATITNVLKLLGREQHMQEMQGSQHFQLRLFNVQGPKLEYDPENHPFQKFLDKRVALATLEDVLEAAEVTDKVRCTTRYSASQKQAVVTLAVTDEKLSQQIAALFSGQKAIAGNINNATDLFRYGVQFSAAELEKLQQGEGFARDALLEKAQKMGSERHPNP